MFLCLRSDGYEKIKLACLIFYGFLREKRAFLRANIGTGDRAAARAVITINLIYDESSVLGVSTA